MQVASHLRSRCKSVSFRMGRRSNSSAWLVWIRWNAHQCCEMQNDVVNGIGAVPSCARLFNYLNPQTVWIQNIENHEGDSVTSRKRSIGSTKHSMNALISSPAWKWNHDSIFCVVSPNFNGWLHCLKFPKNKKSPVSGDSLKDCHHISAAFLEKHWHSGCLLIERGGDTCLHKQVNQP